MIQQLGLPGFHRAAGDKDDRNIETHRSHQHAWCDLVAVGNTHQRIGTVGVTHVLDAIGDDVAARQRVEHAIVTHGDPVIHGDRVELFGHASRFFDLARHQLPHVF